MKPQVEFLSFCHNIRLNFCSTLILAIFVNNSKSQKLNWIRNPEQEKSLRRAEIDKSEETGCFVFITSFVFILNS